ncbi:MAG TPA: hypothetical protein RMH99_02295 [Sandaracinaceae bacterium LLY-WYZ-13_1]|nr:hypothetical protein [Sandaracinaceae bacterium LLY-WYZ-13_1]
MRSFLAGLLGALLLAACGGAGSGTPSSTSSTRRAPPPARDPEAGPETDEDRARQVLGELESYCAGHTSECGATARPEVYPDVEVPASSRRYVDDHRQELRTLGVQLRWDPQVGEFEVVRGNAPVHGGSLRDDP